MEIDTFFRTTLLPHENTMVKILSFVISINDSKKLLQTIKDQLENDLSIYFDDIAILDTKTGLLELFNSDIPKSIRLGEGNIGKVFETETQLEYTDGFYYYYYYPFFKDHSLYGVFSAHSKSGTISKSIWDFLKWVFSYSNIFSLNSQSNPALIVSSSIAKATLSNSLLQNHGIIGTSDNLKETMSLVAQAAPSDITICITGESGTGKELIAKALHESSYRKNGPFIKVNCAALPESIIESELFGHEKGAFTGAASRRKGRFESAHGGSIFLDEIGELSLNVQVKLLRVLQEREIERIGGNSVVKVDVRIITATNKNLEKLVKQGFFREDLYYRLNVFPIRVPPLRERKSDIVLLADFFAEKYALKNNKNIKRLSSPALDLLTMYHWPGNVRELENCIERAVILSTDNVIHAYNLPPSLQSAESTGTKPGSTLGASLSRLEKEMIIEALKVSKGNMAQAALSLDITERQIGLRVRYYGIQWKQYRPT